MTRAVHKNKAVQRSHPNEITPKPRCCRMFMFASLRSGEAARSGRLLEVTDLSLATSEWLNKC